MSEVERAGLKVARVLAEFIEKEALPGLPVSAHSFWHGLAELAAEFGPRTRALLAKRADLQAKIDAWHAEHGPVASDPRGYEVFLREIGYLVPEPKDFTIETSGLDREIAEICGPQLVVPVSNARYALNAANARWGSLYDALYGTDVIPREETTASGYDPARGKKVFAWVADFLDRTFPLAAGSHRDVTSYAIDRTAEGVWLDVKTGAVRTSLQHASAFAGYAHHDTRTEILLENHGLHVILNVDRDHRIGRSHPAGLADVVLESAVTTIEDCEDSVAAVDADDKVGVWRNWLGLMKGDLVETFEKAGRTVTRSLASDRYFTSPDGVELAMKGRSLLLVRNVGHLMTSDAVCEADGTPVGEGLLDAAVTVLCAMHDQQTGANSATGAIYVVKPKMHGPEEVELACDQFGAVEDMLGLKPNTVKIGIMDEERRTSANLKACIYAARHRVFFINTGFLDRTGDEIHTAMRAGPVARKGDLKTQDWLAAYEDRNVLIGIACGFPGRAQIGKGMWTAPDLMAEMVATKGAHPEAGANCAWVPSPTAATLHALHYHATDVFAAQKRRHNQETPKLAALFSMPAADAKAFSADAIAAELDNNAQGILGYVVRWVDQGVGCSKVPDINDVALMEDRATCRISAQHLANWLSHGVVTSKQVKSSFERMAKTVDRQNAGDPSYRPMAGKGKRTVAFQAALDLALKGAGEPSGYTEPILHAARRKVKAHA
jgi:malate synthase